VIRDTYDGSTSNFTGLSESMLRDMPSVVLENTSHGRIDFNENLDLVTMAGGDLIVNFDIDLNISDNLINLQNSNLPGIDKSVNISLYGITYAVPLIYHDAVLCTNCVFISYSSNIYKFSTPSLSFERSLLS